LTGAVSTERIDRGSATLGLRVAELLRREIVRGDRPSGSRLNEVAIAAAFDVSRGPVREAIQRLARDGLVVVEAHRGAFVKSLDRHDVEKLFEFRSALEAEAAALAAAKMTDEGIALLRTLQEQSVSAVSQQDDHSFPDVIDLHELIARLSDNPRLSALINQVNVELRLVRSRSGSLSERAQRALGEHDELIDCLAARDAHRARDVMRSHLDASLANTLALMFSP
jgi:DNA-binding GntR family transcriptional regulator